MFVKNKLSSELEDYATLAAIQQDLQAGTTTCTQLVGQYLARIEENKHLNAFVEVYADEARQRAAEIDAKLATGTAGRCAGLVLGIKDVLCYAGHGVQAGSRILDSYKSPFTATAVQRLLDEDAIVIGRQNCDEFAMGSSNESSYFGPVQNAADPMRVPGGSSGGSAAALAAGLTSLEIGSDIGGSIRNPAHYCGVFGHKPSWNLLPMRGHALAGTLTPTDISVIGPLARSADDLELALSLMAGPDKLEAAGIGLHLPRLEGETRSLRIAVWKTDPMCPVSAAVAARVDAVAAALAAQGATVDFEARPAFTGEHSHRIFSALLMSAMAARFGDKEFDRLVAAADALDPQDQGEAAQTLRAQTLRARDWGRVNEGRTKLRWAWQRFFEQWDFVLAPIMPTTAFAHDQRAPGERTIDIDGTAYPYFMQTFWAGLAGVAYLPATVIPAGPGPDGLPIGLQIIGPAYGDLRTIGLAQRLERMGFAFRAPPGFD